MSYNSKIHTLPIFGLHSLATLGNNKGEWHIKRNSSICQWIIYIYTHIHTFDQLVFRQSIMLARFVLFHLSGKCVMCTTICERRHDGDLKKIQRRKFISFLDLQKLPFSLVFLIIRVILCASTPNQISQTWHESFNIIKATFFTSMFIFLCNSNNIPLSILQVKPGSPIS